MKKILRIAYLATAIMGVLGGIMALVTDDMSEFCAWFTAVAMAGAGFIKETDRE